MPMTAYHRPPNQIRGSPSTVAMSSTRAASYPNTAAG
jgi:hypothetical protein